MKAVLFDAADTLFRLKKSVGSHYARVAEKHGGYIVFAGDDPEADWAGAERAELNVFLLQRPGNDLRGLIKTWFPNLVSV